MRTGVRLGIDVGDVRVGVARSDPQGTMAVPVETVHRNPPGRRDRSGPARGRGRGRTGDRPDLARVAELAAEAEAVEVVVGLPVGLSGAEGPAAGKARAYAAELAAALRPVPVRLVDERMSTVEAQRSYHLRGISVKKSRNRIDAAAAAVILQSALDAERTSGRPPGELVALAGEADAAGTADDTTGDSGPSPPGEGHDRGPG